MISRTIQKDIEKGLFQAKVIVVVGARQVGKTTLIESVLSSTMDHNPSEIIRFNGDDPEDRALLQNKGLEFLKSLISTSRYIFFDEGQKIPAIDQTLKLLVDYYKDSKQILVSGSSSINLLDQIHEPLTGRKRVYTLYPISVGELIQDRGLLPFLKDLETVLRFGLYPEVIGTQDLSEKHIALKELAHSSLYKDIYEFQSIRNPTVLADLLKALALQIGSQVSYTELATLLGIDKNTVISYVDLLEKNYIVYRMYPFYKNKRKEISKMHKIYFWDVGIRNALINNLNPLNDRNDTGALWENFIVNEKLKHVRYSGGMQKTYYFWRTYDGAEIDLVEETSTKLDGYEIKWRSKNSGGPSRLWLEHPNTSFQTITKENFLSFIT